MIILKKTAYQVTTNPVIRNLIREYQFFNIKEPDHY